MINPEKLSRLKTQGGTALIVALFIMALVTTIAIGMLQYFQINLRRTELILHAGQGYSYAQGSVGWAMNQLNQDWVQHQPNKIVDKTPFTLAPSKEPPFVISATLSDAQGLLNLNCLSEEGYQKIFLRLVQIVEPQMAPAIAQGITAALVDWISVGARETSYDNYYLKLNPPYRASHHLMTSVSELLLVKGMTSSLFNKLAPNITALPEKTQININSAPMLIIMSLSPTMSPDAAKSLAIQLQKNPATDPQTLASMPILKNNTIPQNMITVVSNYFLLKTSVTVEDQEMIQYTLLNRMAKEKQAKITIVWQSKGTL